MAGYPCPDILNPGAEEVKEGEEAEESVSEE